MRERRRSPALFAWPAKREPRLRKKARSPLHLRSKASSIEGGKGGRCSAKQGRKTNPVEASGNKTALEGNGTPDRSRNPPTRRGSSSQRAEAAEKPKEERDRTSRSQA